MTQAAVLATSPAVTTVRARTRYQVAATSKTGFSYWAMQWAMGIIAITGPVRGNNACCSDKNVN